jgi:hypothetical protein
MDPRGFWRGLSEGSRAWLLAGAVATVALVVGICIFLITMRPWESREYKNCVHVAQTQLSSDIATSDIESYCHEMFD